MNIRDYVGDTSTNKGIVQTALDIPENSLFFNNGVSAVASNIEADDASGTLRCKRFSIITAVRLKVEQNQLVGVFDEIGILFDALKGA